MQTFDERQSQESQTVESPGATIDLSADTEGVEELAGKLDEGAESFSVTGFKCAECGLAHGHDTSKHRVSDAFAMGDDDAADMDANPCCHCGAHEAAARAGELGIDGGKARSTAGKAPVPDSVRQKYS